MKKLGGCRGILFSGLPLRVCDTGCLLSRFFSTSLTSEEERTLIDFKVNAVNVRASDWYHELTVKNTDDEMLCFDFVFSKYVGDSFLFCFLNTWTTCSADFSWYLGKKKNQEMPDILLNERVVRSAVCLKCTCFRWKGLYTAGGTVTLEINTLNLLQ